MSKIYSSKAVNDFIQQLSDDYDVYTIDGCLANNYIITRDGYKTIVIKEQYLNEWSSGNTIRMYNETPKKYQDVINAILDGDDARAEKLFFA